MTKIQWFFIICLWILTHTVFFLPIFDIYYTTPLVYGMTPQRSSISAPAKRLVLVSLDGLRASSMFETHSKTKHSFPFCRNIVETKGAWGVVNNDGPTESRPAHIAMTAGIHEDPASIYLKWIESPATFDTVFNESRQTWGIGSWVVLHHFKNVTPFRVLESDMKVLEAFADHTKHLLETSETDSTLRTKLHEDKIVIFLHLDVTDYLSHDYLKNARNLTAIGIFRKKALDVDKNLERVVAMVEEYYNHDNKTAFVVTGDHGMDSHGDHGGNTEQERLVPLVVWGAGVRSPIKNDHGRRYNENFSAEWNLSHVVRHDMQQVDVAPLLASLIGVHFPMNSEGQLHHGYLNLSTEERAKLIYAHTRQVLALMEMRRKWKKGSLLSDVFDFYRDPVLHRLDEFHKQIGHLLSVNRFSDVISKCTTMGDAAITWLQTHRLSGERRLLRFAVAVGFIGWILYIVTFLRDNGNKLTRDRMDSQTCGCKTCLKSYIFNCWKHRKSFFLLLIYFSITCFVLHELALPIRYQVYIMVMLMMFFWSLVYIRREMLLWLMKTYMKRASISGSTFVHAMTWVCLTQLMMYTLLLREYLSAGLVVLGILPWLSFYRSHNKRPVMAWSLLCALLALFPQMSIPKYPDELERLYILITGCGVCLGALLMILATAIKKVCLASKRNIFVNIIQILLLAISTYISCHQVTLQSENITVLCWTILGVSPIWPLFVTNDAGSRLFTIFLSLISPFILLGKSWDVLFFACLCVLLCVWCWMEHTYCTNISHAGPVYSTAQQLPWSDTKTSSTPDCSNIVDQHQTTQYNISRIAGFIAILFTSFFGRESIASSVVYFRIPFYCFGGEKLEALSATSSSTMLLDIKNIITAVYALCVLAAVHNKVKFSLKQFFIITVLIIVVEVSGILSSSVVYFRIIRFYCFGEKLEALPATSSSTMLLAIKNIIPAVYALCVLEAVYTKVKFSLKQFVIITVLVGDIISLQMLYHFYETGTRFVISTVSIVQYVIPTALVLLLTVLFPTTHVLMTVQLKPVVMVKRTVECTRNFGELLYRTQLLKLALHGTASICGKLITCPMYVRMCLAQMFNRKST